MARLSIEVDVMLPNVARLLEFDEGALNMGESDTPREAGGLMGWAASKAVGSWV